METENKDRNEKRREKIPCKYCQQIFNRNSQTYHQKICKKKPNSQLNLFFDLK